MLPPVQFSPGTPTEFIVSWDEEQWVEVFSALMAGADLLYPEKSHEVLWHLLKQVEYPVPNIGFGFDSEVNCFGHEAVVVSGAALSIGVNTTQMHNIIVQQSPNALNNKVRWVRYMSGGTWSFSYLYIRNTGSGIIDIYVTPAGGSTVVILNNADLRGALLVNQFQRGSFTLTDSALCTIEIEVVATSSGVAYANPFTLLQMWRTGS